MGGVYVDSGSGSGVQVDVGARDRVVGVGGGVQAEVVGSGFDSCCCPPPELDPSLNHQFIWKTPAPSSYHNQLHFPIPNNFLEKMGVGVKMMMLVVKKEKTYREMIKQPPTHIKIPKTAPWTQVPDCSLGRFASIGDGYGFTTLRTGVSTSILGCVEGDNIVGSHTKGISSGLT